MAVNQTNSIDALKQQVTNLVTKMLRLLDSENLDLNSTVEIFEAGRFLAFEAIEILEENGIETESWKIITHESFREIIESLPSRQERSEIGNWQMAEVKEKLKQMLRKFLMVEDVLNDQHN